MGPVEKAMRDSGVMRQVYDAKRRFGRKFALPVSLPDKQVNIKKRIIIFMFHNNYSTVTDFAKFLGWSTLHPLITAI